MLPFLIPSAALARASSQLARRSRMRLSQQVYLPSRSSSSSIITQNVSKTARHDQDAEHQDDGSASPPRPHRDNTAFTHFFDKRTPPLASSPTLAPAKAKASHEIVSASRDAVTAFRNAISTREPAAIIEAYQLLMQAHHAHAQHIRGASSRFVDITDIGFPIRKADIQTAIRHMVKHAQREGHMTPRLFHVCHQMYRDMSQQFGFRIAPTDLHRHLQTFCLSDNPTMHPCVAFDQLRANHPEWRPNSSEWGMVIAYLERHRSYIHALKLWTDALEYGVEPEDPLRDTMIKVFLAVNNKTEADALRQQLSQHEAHLDIDTLTSAVEDLCQAVSQLKQSDPELMSELRTHAMNLQKTMDSNTELATLSSAWKALLRYEAIVAGPAHALQTARQAWKPGLFDSETLSLLLRLHEDELNDLQSSDDALELLDRIQSACDPKRTTQPDDQCYSILIQGLLNSSGSKAEDACALDQDGNLVPDEDGDRGRSTCGLPSPNQIREAQLLYDHVRALGMPPTPVLAMPLLTAYCEAFLPSLHSAMKLVRDVLEYGTPSSLSARKTTTSTRRKTSRSCSSAVGISTVRPVIDACIKLKDLACARDLLSRLHEAGIALEPAHKLELMRRLIGITTSWTQAFQVYRTVSRFPTLTSSGTRSEGGLDERGYISLLQSLRALTFTDSQNSTVLPAPPEELLGIVQDMRAAGHRPSCAIYTSILDYYAKTAQPSFLGVQLTHEMLKQDEGLEPDLPLINALMNAYNRADEPAMVLAIWDSLMATRQEIDGVTLSVFFDTAGRHGLLSLARRAISTVRRIEAQGTEARGRSAMTKGAWDSWLECLARCGRLEEAIELAFGEMRKTLFREAIDAHDLDDAADGEAAVPVALLTVKSSQTPVKDRRGQVVGPDAKTMGTLLRFAARERDRRQKRVMGSLFPGATSEDSRGRGTSIWHTLRTRIREELSWLYPQVKHIGENTPL
ncbi:hypothetical protein EX895_000936 [Sporisorium graminicola]|uniref:Pentacotripeptide-repeat region of PRORP domain-containing protein n=1 Tax=Sporisorium graminicola TaxID=280036 RepID=A0A4U7L4N3_9BASI|nr:hypothetical protein EX895_000936 [Sporisorium graminicola]TKY90938.1 hypothetical protein EX895_000936 [Sporisorium graminicola]